MIIKAAGNMPRTLRKIETRGRLSFYGSTAFEIKRFLQLNSDVKFAYEGQYLHIFLGSYKKNALGRTEEFDAMSLRHQGWGTSTAGIVSNPIVDMTVGRAMKATGAVVYQYFLGLTPGNGNRPDNVPKFLRDQKTCQHIASFVGSRGGPLNGFDLGALAQKL